MSKRHHYIRWVGFMLEQKLSCSHITSLEKSNTECCITIFFSPRIKWTVKNHIYFPLSSSRYAHPAAIRLLRSFSHSLLTIWIWVFCDKMVQSSPHARVLWTLFLHQIIVIYLITVRTASASIFYYSYYSAWQISRDDKSHHEEYKQQTN